MKVHLYPADQQGCGFYRIALPGHAVTRVGFEIEVFADFPVQWGIRGGKKYIKGVHPIDADVVVVQRPFHRIFAECIPMIQKQGVAVVVEVDDDFHALHHDNPAWFKTHPKRDPDLNRNHLARACALADLVTVTTPALARRYGSHGRVAVLPNYVPGQYTTIRPEKAGNVVGWAGNVFTHPRDLLETQGGVAEAIEEAGARFRVIGRAESVQKQLDLTFPPEHTEWLPLDEYPQEVAKLDVGIVPLERSAFNEAKSWLKGLEYAALGVPFVASPRSEYEKLASEGLGILAKSRRRDWKREVKALLECHDCRRAASETGRQVVMEKFTMEGNAWRWAEAWHGAARSVRAVV